VVKVRQTRDWDSAHLVGVTHIDSHLIERFSPIVTVILVAVALTCSLIIVRYLGQMVWPAWFYVGTDVSIERSK
jgi:hypothetical protein